MWAFPMNQDGNGATGAIAKMEGAPIGPGGTIVYFVCEDCAQAAKRAKEAGGRIVKDKFSIGDYGNIALVSDLDGNVIGIPSNVLRGHGRKSGRNLEPTLDDFRF